MWRTLTLLALISGCRIVNEPDSEPTSLRIIIEPETIQTRRDAQQRIVLELIVRTFNDGPGYVIMPACGHQLQRAEPNGRWVHVYTVSCAQVSGPPFHVAAGEHFGYPVRIVAASDSAPWNGAAIAGRYRVQSYISDQALPGGALGRLLSEHQRTSPEFTVRAPTP